MIVTPATLKALMTGFKNDFQRGLKSAESQYTRIAMTVPSSTTSNTYGWLGQFPKMREWIGSRVVKNMEAHGHVIQNKKWESTVGVLRTDIEDDNLGIYKPLMEEMGRAATAHPDEIIFPLLNAGFANTCYDGQFFFDVDHPVNPEVDGSGTDVSVANAIINATYTGDPWFLIDDTRTVMPLIFQQRKKPIFTSMTALTDEEVFTNDTYRFGVDCRDNTGYGLWQLAFGVRDALNLDNLWAAYTAMRAFKADGGRPLGIRPRTLVVSVANEKAARELVDVERLANGSSNPLYKKFDILVADYL